MNDPLFGNKLAAAALVAILLTVGPPVVINTLSIVLGGHHDHHEFDPADPFHLSYSPVEFSFDSSADAEEKVALDLGTLLASASADRGARSAGICKACHSFEQGGSNGQGPNLWNIVGSDIAAVDGFSYTAALAGKEGVWDYASLDAYLANSQAYVPGTQMAQMISKDTKRADILAYLATLSDSPVPFPAPAPSVETTADAGAAAGSL